MLANPVTKDKIIPEFNAMFSQASTTWNPHIRLEFTKVCIPTVTERVQAERKKSEQTEEELLNYEFQKAIGALEKGEGGNG